MELDGLVEKIFFISEIIEETRFKKMRAIERGGSLNYKSLKPPNKAKE